MTRVKTGVKGDFQADNAPKTPENCPPVLPPNEDEFSNTTQTQECNHCLKFLYIEQVWFIHKCRKCLKLVFSNRYEGS